MQLGSRTLRPACRIMPLMCRCFMSRGLRADVVTARQFVLPKASSKAALIIEPRQHYGEGGSGALIAGL